MRLTLRTLLAYLDGILDPNDAEDIGKKTEESEYAAGLVHRIRDAMRRLRLGTTGLTDRDPRLDPNTVAEYLDNTLPSESVTNFEKVCLDSDVHLAEVASCHQILTLVLGEPAEIDPASRKRMYQIKDVHAGAEPPTLPAHATSPLGTTTTTLDLGDDEEFAAVRKLRTRPTVPEYLREPRKKQRWLPAAIAVALIVCFTGVVLMALGQFEPGTPLGDALVRWGVVAPAQDLAAKPQDEEPRVGNTAQSQKAAVEPGEEPASEPTGEPAAEPGEKPTAPPTAEPGLKAEDSPEPEAAAPPQTGKSEGIPELVHEPATELGGEAAAQPALKSDVKPTIQPEVGTENGADQRPAAESSALPPEPLGRLMSNDQILLKKEPASGWVRIATNQVLIPQQLLTLPTYRAMVTLTVGATLEVLGGTQIELLASGPRELPGIRILHGRVVMMPLAKAGSQLRVAFGDRAGVLTFTDAESVAALDVRRLHTPGTDPEAGPPHVAADLYVAAGGVIWDETGGGQVEKALQLTGPQSVSFNAQLTSTPAAAKELPPWIVAEPLNRLERGASAAIAQALPADGLARLGLLELSTSRPQKEVRWLALRCLAHIGQFRDLVAALNDPDYKLDWPEYVDELRTAVARDPESAKAVRLTLEKQFPQQSAELYRMLWGYSENDLEAGEDEKLVRALDNDTLAVRVLGFWNLKDLTGLGLFYKPEQTSAKRQQPTLRWRQRLEANEIRLKTPEEKVGAAAEENTASPADPDK